MSVLRRAVVALAALGASALVAPCARPSALVRASSLSRSAALRATQCGECDDWNPFGDGCKPCEDTGGVFVNEQLVTSKTLREVDVVGASGQRAQMSDIMGRGGSVVVFLRHLG